MARANADGKQPASETARRDIIDGHMTLNDTMQLPDAIIGTDGTWHDRPTDMDDDDWKCAILAAILESDIDCRVSFVGIK